MNQISINVVVVGVLPIYGVPKVTEIGIGWNQIIVMH